MKTPSIKLGYYYLHTNSQIMWKPEIIVESNREYFNSPFVVKYWKVKDYFDFQQMTIEAKKIDCGARHE